MCLEALVPHTIQSRILESQFSINCTLKLPDQRGPRQSQSARLLPIRCAGLTQAGGLALHGHFARHGTGRHDRQSAEPSSCSGASQQSQCQRG